MQWVRSCEQIRLDRNQTNKQTRYVTQVAHMIYDADDGAGCGDGSEWFNQTVLAEKQSR